jgi:hypothetical protein
MEARAYLRKNRKRGKTIDPLGPDAHRISQSRFRNPVRRGQRGDLLPTAATPN